MVDRTKVMRDKHESPTERPREAKMARAKRDLDRPENKGTGRKANRRGAKQEAERRGKTLTPARRNAAARNEPTTRRRAAERLNRPQSKNRTRRQVDETKDHIRQRADNAPLGVRRAAKLGEEEVASPDVSLEVAHGPEGEANAGQDLREPRMIPSKGGKDPNARHPKGRAEKRPGDEHAEGET